MGLYITGVRYKVRDVQERRSDSYREVTEKKTNRQKNCYWNVIFHFDEKSHFLVLSYMAFGHFRAIRIRKMERKQTKTETKTTWRGFYVCSTKTESPHNK